MAIITEACIDVKDRAWAVRSEEHLADGPATSAKYNASDPNQGHDYTFFVQHSRNAFAD